MLPERMSQVTLLCRNEDTEQVTAILAELKAVHLTDHQRQVVGNTIVDIGKSFASAESLSTALLGTRNMLAKLPSAAPMATSMPLLERIERVNNLMRDFAAEEARQAARKQELAHIEQQLQLLGLFNVSPIETLFGARSVETILAKGKEPVEIDAVGRQENEHATLFTVLKRDADAAKAQLQAAHYTIIDLSPLREFTGPQEHVISSLQTRKHLLEHEPPVDFREHAPFLQASEPILALELLKAQAPLHFGTTKHITLVRGFIPTRRVHEFEERLAGANINALIETTPATEAPVSLRNPKGMKSFESLMRLYTLPKYNEIDPTTIMAFTFPIFFGFMLGDVGYGLCAFALFLTLKTMYPSIREFANIFLISAVSTVVFGFVFGEVFGSESFAGFHLTPLLHRTENIMLMFGIAVAIGLLHLNLGLIMGMYNERHHGWFFAFVKKASWMVMQLGLLLLIVSLGWVKIPALQTHIIIPLTVLALAIAGLWYTEEGTGIIRSRGIIEALLGMSNIISYTRLVALGLASVYLAFVVNQIAGGMFLKSGLWPVFGVVILLLGHAFNLALGLLGPFLHSLRLHYVEFFTKFYEGGGKPYKPFGGEQWQ